MHVELMVPLSGAARVAWQAASEIIHGRRLRSRQEALSVPAMSAASYGAQWMGVGVGLGRRHVPV